MSATRTPWDDEITVEISGVTLTKSYGLLEIERTEHTLKISGVLFKSLTSLMAATSKNVNWRHCK